MIAFRKNSRLELQSTTSSPLAEECPGCRDSLLDSSSKGLDLGLKLEIIEEQDKMCKSKEEDAEDEWHK